MGTCQSLVKLELRAAVYDAFLMCDIVVEYLCKVQDLWLVFDECEHNYCTGILELRILVELVEEYLSVDITAMLDNYPHTVTSRFVTQVGDTLDTLFLCKRCDSLAEHTLVYLIRYLGDNDAVMLLIYLGIRSDRDPAFTCQICLFYSVSTVDSSTRREIRSLNELHKIEYRAVGVLHTVDSGINDLG